MKRFVLVVILMMLFGCSTKMQHPIVIGAEVFHRSEFSVIEIASHGAIGDGLAIAIGGGAYVTSIREKLLEIQNKEDVKNVLVTSTNSLLAKTILANAINDLEADSLKSVNLVFAGKEVHGNELRLLVEATGAKFTSVIR